MRRRCSTSFSAAIRSFAFLPALSLNFFAAAARSSVISAASGLGAIGFFAANGMTGFLTLGAVFLVVTGGEALYADLGHFGIAPIRRAWFLIVFPALVLNYLGQAALLMHRPEAVDAP